MIIKNMQDILNFLNQGWVGALIGLFSLLLAIYLFRQSQILPKIAFQMRNDKLIGGQDAELPGNVSIYYQKDLSQPIKTEVSQLSKTIVVFWNAGKTTFRGSDVVADDPIRIELSSNSQILDVQVTRRTRGTNRFNAYEDSARPFIAILGFDFLDPQDGARIEILHTSNGRPKIHGTIRGLPQGCSDWGSLPYGDGQQLSLQRRRSRSKILQTLNLTVISFIYLLLSIFLVFAGLFPDLFLLLFPILGKPQEAILTPGRVGWQLILLGLFFSFPAMFFLWSQWRRFPRKLAD